MTTEFYDFFKTSTDYFASLLGETSSKKRVRVFRENVALKTKRSLMPPTETLTNEFDDLLQDLFSEHDFEFKYSQIHPKSTFHGEYLVSDARQLSQGWQYHDEGVSLDVKNDADLMCELNAELRAPVNEKVSAAFTAKNTFGTNPLALENVTKDMRVGLRLDSACYSGGVYAIPGSQKPIEAYGYAKLKDVLKGGLNLSYQAGRLVPLQFDGILQCFLTPLSYLTIKGNPHKKELSFCHTHHQILDGPVKQLDSGVELSMDRFGKRTIQGAVGVHLGENILLKTRLHGGFLSSTLAMRNWAAFSSIFNVTMHRNLSHGETTWGFGLNLEFTSQPTQSTYRRAF